MDKWTVSGIGVLSKNGKQTICPWVIDAPNCGTWCPHFLIVQRTLEENICAYDVETVCKGNDGDYCMDCNGIIGVDTFKPDLQEGEERKKYVERKVQITCSGMLVERVLEG